MRALAIILLLAGATACSMFKDEHPCQSVEEYQFARSVPPVSVPRGMNAPDASAELNVPDGSAPAESLAQNAACLQFPPNYFDKPL